MSEQHKNVQSALAAPAPQPPYAEKVLFKRGTVALHSGQMSDWIVDCSVLSAEDWRTVAHLLAERLPAFGSVEGIVRGGLELAKAIELDRTRGPVLIVDDVLTTGASMEQQRAGREAIGAVLFARGPVPSWVTALFTLAPVGPGPAARAEEKGWQPIETAPKDGTEVLLLYGDHKVEIGRWRQLGGLKPRAPHWGYRRSMSSRYDREHQPTHWMPLPNSPRVAREAPDGR